VGQPLAIRSQGVRASQVSKTRLGNPALSWGKWLIFKVLFFKFFVLSEPKQAELT
jgi:hypothetical protein